MGPIMTVMTINKHKHQHPQLYENRGHIKVRCQHLSDERNMQGEAIGCPSKQLNCFSGNGLEHKERPPIISFRRPFGYVVDYFKIWAKVDIRKILIIILRIYHG